MKHRRQALSVVATIQIPQERLIEVFHGSRAPQIQPFAFEPAKGILDHSIVQTIFFAAHTLCMAWRIRAICASHSSVMPSISAVRAATISSRWAGSWTAKGMELVEVAENT